MQYKAARPDRILMAVTSQVKAPLPFGEMIISDWQTAGWLKLSVIKPFTKIIQKDLVIKKLGRLTPSDLQFLYDLLSVLEILGKAGFN